MYLATERSAPGVYRWMVGGQAAHQVVVNFPEGESDLRGMRPDGLKEEAGSGGSLTRRAALSSGLPLWPWLVGLAALLLLGEGVLTSSKPGVERQAA
jgi:hypothetical protein